MKFKKWYYPGPSEGGGAPADAAAEAAPVVVADPVQPGSFMDDDVPDSLDEMEKMGKAPVKSAEDELAKKSAAADATAAAKTAGDEAKKTDAADTDDEFEIEIEKPAAPVEEETNWQTLAKETGLGELKTDSYEDYKAAYDARLVQEREAAKAEYQKADEIEQLKKFGPQAVEMFKYLSQEGNTMESFMAPMKQFDDIIAMDDESVVRLEFEGRKYEKEVIDAKIETLRSEGKLKDMAYDVRKVVENLKEQKQASILKDSATKFDQAKQTFDTQRAQEDSKIKDALSRLTHLHGGKVTQEMRDDLWSKWTSGEFRRRMADDPAAVVRFMANEEYGEKTVKTIRKLASQDGKAGFINKEVHNIKLPGGGSKGSQQVEKVDDFDAWKIGLEESK